MTDRRSVALDTSFWTVGFRADVLQYLFEFFAVHAPPAVRGEILAPDPGYPNRVYGYAAWFRVLEERDLLVSTTPGTSMPLFGRGESEAIALAREHGWWLLMNDSRPVQFAQQAGITVITVPTFIVYLYERGRIALAAARKKLSLIVSWTGRQIMASAEQDLDTLARQQGES